MKNPDRPYTPFQQECLRALATLPNGHGSAGSIAWSLCNARRKASPTGSNRHELRPSKMRFAVSAAMRALLARDPLPMSHYGDQSEHIVRLSPRDMWDAATWCLTAKSRAAVLSFGPSVHAGT